MGLLLDLFDGLGRTHAGDHDVAALLQVQDKGDAQGRVTAENDCETPQLRSMHEQCTLAHRQPASSRCHARRPLS